MNSDKNDDLFDGRAKQEMKAQWLRRQMKNCKDSYTDPRAHTIFCGTWNVNGRARVDDEGLTDWLFPTGSKPHDIYVCGFQEIVELTPVNVATDMMGPQRTQFWLEQIANCFKKDATEQYVCIGVKNLVGILMCVYVRQSLFSFISDVRWSTTCVGILGVMGNKGAVVMRFNMHSTAICVVCAHLAASRDNIVARNSDYRNIMERTLLEKPPQDTMAFDDDVDSDRPKFLQQLPGGNGSHGEALLGILDHDIVFWIGDFNYRIDLSLSIEDIMKLLQHDNIVALRKKDQLNIERGLGNVFHGFEEGPLTFPPTYKFQPGTDVYETRPEKKQRPPAWCDRVLWREPANKGADRTVQQVSYRISRLRPSDHKPVGSSFIVQTRVVDADREKARYMRLVRELDRMENEEQPKVEVGPSLDIVISDVCFQDRRKAELRIKNVGTAVANWRFVPKNSDVQLSEPWIHLEPNLGMVAPGEEENAIHGMRLSLTD